MAMADDGAWWRGTRALAFATVLLWIVVGLVLPLIAYRFRAGLVLGFPVPMFLAAVVAPAALCALLFSFVQRQAMLDRRHGVDEA